MANGELPEFSIRGPFGGVQSEISLEAIENLGFANCENMMFRRGSMSVRPKFHDDYVPQIYGFDRIMDLTGTIAEQTWTMDVPLTSLVFEPLVGVADFFTAQGNRVQTVFTPTRVFAYNGHSWDLPLGYFAATASDWRFSTAVVGEKLCFSQGIDRVQIWDGSSTSFLTTDLNVPARYLSELANHLILGNTFESGSRAYQRIHWSAAGDPTDLTSLNAGQTDLFNDLGPINGLNKLYQYGFVYQQLGIVQMIPTGNGLKPFDFISLSAHSKGLTVPGSLAAFGETQCYYVGKDNVYMFDGTSSSPIGDMPIDGRRRVGARSRILADIMQSDSSKTLGLVTSSVNGNPFSAYWLIIPGIAIWVFNIDEQNWTRWTSPSNITTAGAFTLKTPVRMKDLLGSIGDQNWMPLSFTNDNPFDSIMLGTSDGRVLIFDFTGLSEVDAFAVTGQLAFGDYRHEKQVVKLRSITKDVARTTVTYSLTNNNGQVWSRESTVGNGTGLSRPDIYQPNLPGAYFQLRVDVPSGQNFNCSELALVYSSGGELR